MRIIHRLFCYWEYLKIRMKVKRLYKIYTRLRQEQNNMPIVIAYDLTRARDCVWETMRKLNEHSYRVKNEWRN